MITFDLKLVNAEGNLRIDGFSRGHFTIGGRHGHATSEGRTPDQSMMMFLSIVELLDGIRRFLTQTANIQYRFVGIDSSFQFLLQKVEKNSVELVCNGRKIDEVSQGELAHAVWSGVFQFLVLYGERMRDSDPIMGDLNAAVQEFRKTFGFE